LFISLCRQRNEPKKTTLRSFRYSVCRKSLRKRTRIACSNSFCSLSTSCCTAFNATRTKAACTLVPSVCSAKVRTDIYLFVHFPVVHFFISFLFISLCRQRNEPKKTTLRSFRYSVCRKSLRKRTRIACSNSFCSLSTSCCTAFNASRTKATCTLVPSVCRDEVKIYD